jgi:hypothetical protein
MSQAAGGTPRRKRARGKKLIIFGSASRCKQMQLAEFSVQFTLPGGDALKYAS